MALTTTYVRARFLAFAQQRWIARAARRADTNSFSTLFAGHPAHLQFETDGAWRLSYLGFRSERIFHPGRRAVRGTRVHARRAGAHGRPHRGARRGARQPEATHERTTRVAPLLVDRTLAGAAAHPPSRVAGRPAHRDRHRPSRPPATHGARRRNTGAPPRAHGSARPSAITMRSPRWSARPPVRAAPLVGFGILQVGYAVLVSGRDRPVGTLRRTVRRVAMAVFALGAPALSDGVGSVMYPGTGVLMGAITAAYVLVLLIYRQQVARAALAVPAVVHRRRGGGILAVSRRHVEDRSRARGCTRRRRWWPCLSVSASPA
ncbi:hypothetical protein L0Z42_29810 [Burkholderia multivorans]|uniref:hypothetical protein n=1 Tax=Burkholderia multivorans TaxID=87883 RepID=UPI00207D6CF3|nr:hypothetical protein [Burkholderia multivorans]MCO1374679.1 hypothetical protein [Burkholderia multivorans]